jgi:NADPH-dependent glutamate synthase beta subunit-like oxidoreductase/ferredoxin
MTDKTINIIINGKRIDCKKDDTILDAALNAGIYIPTLCYHPDMPSYGACGLCAVEVKGSKEPVLSCNTTVEMGMEVRTDSSNIKKVRQEKLSIILANHPHACLVCAEKEGCAREPCSLNVPLSERCCEKLGDCELERVADYIGIPENTPRYRSKNLPILKDNPFIVRNLNLCIGCGRCIRACSDIRGIDALGTLPDTPELIDPRIFPEKLIESGCQFCGICVEVCPTGSLLFNFEKKKDDTNCRNGCPANIDIPRFLRQISNEKFSDALKTIYENAPFPATLGYVCYYPCESECLRAELDSAVSIRVLKRFAFEQSEKINIEKIQKSTGKKIAVIGSGPAGLSCAFYLTKWGNNVTVFEEKRKCGGMLRYGIPSFRLPRNVLDGEIEVIEKIGVDIRLNSPVSSIKEILDKGFDAVFVGIGAQKGSKMQINGEDDPRVIDALQFLNEVYCNVNPNNEIKIDKIKIGKQVAVIGGGNTAIDAARTALRLGAKVTLFYRRSKKEMPAFIEEFKQAKNEGVVFRFLTTPVSIHSNKKNLKVEFIKLKLGEKDKSNRPRPIPIKESNFFSEFDNVIIAIGQKVDPIKGIEIDNNNLKKQKNLEVKTQGKIYLGGDILGPSSVVESIAIGRKAAVRIHIDLGGSKEETLPFSEKPSPNISSKNDFLKKRIDIPMLKEIDGKNNFSEVELPLKKSDGIGEARRCFQCDLCLYLSKLPLPPVKIIVFNKENVSLVPEIAGVFTLFDNNKEIVEIKGTDNMKKMLKDKLKSSDKIKFFKFEDDPMYSKRESELLQQYIKKHGEMPSGGDELDDLF